MVEFALVLPLLVFLLFGMIEFGKAFNYWLDVNHLANEGVRFAVVNKNPGATSGLTLQQWVRQQAETNEVRSGGTTSVPSAAQVTLCYPAGAGSDNSGDPIRMKMSVQYNLLPLIGGRLGIGQITLVGTATQRIERPRDSLGMTPAYTPDNGGVCT